MEKASIRLETVRRLPEYNTISRAGSLDSTETTKEAGYYHFFCCLNELTSFESTAGLGK